MQQNSGFHPIGVFDSGYGGLTILKELVNELPEFDYIYLGDNARNPYGTRSFETVYEYTLQCVKRLFDEGCHLVILACNTASAKALRTIQQKDLPNIDNNNRVLGVIRPTTEISGTYSSSRHIGVLATPGTITSESYKVEIKKFFPEAEVFQEACPMWVPIVENNEFDSEGADYFIQKNLQNLLSQSNKIDTIILGCTHYPLLIPKIKKYLPPHIQLLSQGPIVAKSLADYLNRHRNIAEQCSRGNGITFYTTDSTILFDKQASIFFGADVNSIHLSL